MREVILEVIETLSATYGPPPGTPDGYASVLNALMVGYDDEAIREALKAVTGSFLQSGTEKWPVPARFKKAIDLAISRRAELKLYSGKPSVAARKTQEEIDKDQDRIAWRDLIVAKYGSMDNWLLQTTRANRAHRAGGRS